MTGWQKALIWVALSALAWLIVFILIWELTA